MQNSFRIQIQMNNVEAVLKQERGIMDPLAEIGMSKRQIKNAETKRKLYGAMEQIMNQYDYNTVTIRNICKVADVSYGSFYNLFDSKENFLMYYLSTDFTEYKQRYYESHTSFDELSFLERSVDIFVCCAKYNVDKGVKFISAFYQPNNDSLFPNDRSPERDYAFTPLVKQGMQLLEKAREEGELSPDTDVRKMIYMYCYLFNGITFNWCLSGGRIDMEGLTGEILAGYIESMKRK